ncbi:hypothetical protein [Arcobacter ellisii]|uniref:Uncharacterized protein n=1 Tax=Arcobacter ellisii TaxID=913109 RepID=A0A347U6J4_9BACT|nr:hypothetical protein [Arcobacter ellisii]AXX94472.1 hypothetical protein AELL_0792 [Arcobacter ellisii]RXI31169.1 hypothetical protein CP962_06830 [Arcobacter ellisii]
MSIDKNKLNATSSNVEEITTETPKETAKKVEPNTVVTQEFFSESKMLDIALLNNELNSMNRGELRFTVIVKGEYRFNKTDKNGIDVVNSETGEIEQIVSPYVEVTGEGLKGKISTKRLKKEEIELLEQGQSYFGTYMLSTDSAMNFQVEFTSVVPYRQELESRVRNMK